MFWEIFKIQIAISLVVFKSFRETKKWRRINFKTRTFLNRAIVTKTNILLSINLRDLTLLLKIFMSCYFQIILIIFWLLIKIYRNVFELYKLITCKLHNKSNIYSDAWRYMKINYFCNKIQKFRFNTTLQWILSLLAYFERVCEYFSNGII